MRLLAVLVLAPLFATAQAPPAATPPAPRVIGEVLSVDAQAQQLKLKPDSGEVSTVGLSEQTRYLRVPPGEKDLKKASPIQLSDIGPGDRVLARGSFGADPTSLAASTVIVMTRADLAQKQQREQAEWQQRGVAGVVTAVNPDSKEIIIKERSQEGKAFVVDTSKSNLRRYAPDSVRFSDAKPSSFGDLKIGDTVRVLGTKSEDGTHITAEEIVSGSFRTLAATIVSVDAASGTLKVTDLQTKKPLTIHTSADSTLRRVPPTAAQMMAARARGMTSSPGAGGSGAGAPGMGGPRQGASRAGGGPDGVRPVFGGPGGGPPAGAREIPGPGGPGMPGPGGRGGQGGNFDFARMLERMPVLSLAELKAGDAIVVSSTKSADASNLTAIALVAGVEPFLASAPRNSAGEVNLGMWNMDIAVPGQ